MTSGSGPDKLQLKVNLDVLASTCIKRKKPWPKLALVGEVIYTAYQILSSLFSNHCKFQCPNKLMHSEVGLIMQCCSNCDCNIGDLCYK